MWVLGCETVREIQKWEGETEQNKFLNQKPGRGLLAQVEELAMERTNGHMGRKEETEEMETDWEV